MSEPMEFEHIEIDLTEHEGQPYVADTEILVTEVLEELAECLSVDALQKAFPQIGDAQLAEVLLYAADSVRIRHESVRDRLGGWYTYASQLALKYPSADLKYHLFDAEDETKPIASLTEFQLEYITSTMNEPEDEDEGYYFGRIELGRMALHVRALLEAAQVSDNEANRLQEKTPEDVDAIAREVVKAELLEAKSAELQTLHDAIEPVLGSYDAFEITWQPIEDENEK